MLTGFRDSTGKAAAMVGSHAQIANVERVEGVPYTVLPSSGKDPYGTPDRGGFTGWVDWDVNALLNASQQWLTADVHAVLSAETPVFTTQPAGVFGQVQKVTVTNSGTQPLKVYSARILPSGPGFPVFSVVSDGCTLRTIAPGRGCVIQVRFARCCRT